MLEMIIELLVMACAGAVLGLVVFVGTIGAFIAMEFCWLAWEQVWMRKEEET